MTRLPALPALLALVCVPLAARAADRVTESDYATLRKLEYADALFEKRKMFARRDKEKLAAAEAERAKAYKDAGWTEERRGQVGDLFGEVFSTLRSEKNGDLSPEDAAGTLAEYDKTTVAVARAHYEEYESSNDSQRAEQQVRDEEKAEKAGDPPTQAQLAGTWIFDADATIKAMAGDLLPPAEQEKMKADLVAKVGTPSYTFGPGNQITSRGRGPDGKEKTDKGTYRLDGRKIYFKNEGGRREHDLDIGIRKGKLQMGMGFAMSVFSKK